MLTEHRVVYNVINMVVVSNSQMATTRSMLRRMLTHIMMGVRIGHKRQRFHTVKTNKLIIDDKVQMVAMFNA